MFVIITSNGAGQTAPQQHQSTGKVWLPGTSLINKLALKRTGATLLEDAAAYGTGIRSSRCQTLRRGQVHAYRFTGNTVPPLGDSFRNLRTVYDRLMQSFVICRDHKRRRTWQTSVRINEIVFASDASHGSNVWATITETAVAPERAKKLVAGPARALRPSDLNHDSAEHFLVYSGGQYDFMSALFASARAGGFDEIQNEADGWSPLFGPHHCFEIFYDCATTQIPVSGSVGLPVFGDRPLWGQMSLNAIPQGCHNGARLDEPVATLQLARAS